MAKEPSFDVVSEVDMQEVNNAINQTTKEITQRFDFKGTKSVVEVENGNSIKIVTEDEFSKDVLISEIDKLLDDKVFRDNYGISKFYDEYDTCLIRKSMVIDTREKMI